MYCTEGLRLAWAMAWEAKVVAAVVVVVAMASEVFRPHP